MFCVRKVFFVAMQPVNLVWSSIWARYIRFDSDRNLCFSFLFSVDVCRAEDSFTGQVHLEVLNVGVWICFATLYYLTQFLLVGFRGFCIYATHYFRLRK